MRWAHFHDVEPLPPGDFVGGEEEEGGGGGGRLLPRDALGLAPVPSQPLTASTSLAPESHGALRSVEQRQRMMDTTSERSEVGRGWVRAG